MGRCRYARAIWLVGISLFSITSGSAGCSQDPTTASEFEAAVDPLECRHLAKCGDIGKSEESSCPTDRAADRAHFPSVLDRQKAIAAGTLAFDAAAARSCLDALHALMANDPCTPWDSPAAVLAGPSCRGVYRGLVPIGGTCANDLECAGGYCDTRGRNSTCGGSCNPFIATGQPCPSGAGCLPDDACDQFQGGAVPRTCQPAVRPGDPIGTAHRSAAGGPCLTRLSCVPGLLCTGPFQWNGTANVGHCAAPLDVGQPCDPSIQYSGCAGDLTCDTVSRTCLAAGRAESDCDYYHPCRAHLYCDFSQQRCVAQPAYGAPCSNQHGEPCDIGYCQGGICSFYCP